MSVKILIIDDARGDHFILARLIRQEGWTALSAFNGAEGLAQARAEQPDLITLDVNMPDLSGFEVCQELKSDPATQHIPVVLFTVRNRISDIMDGLEAGADGFLTKEAPPEELMARLRLLVACGAEILAPPPAVGQEASLTLERRQILHSLVHRFNEVVWPSMTDLLGTGSAEALVRQSLARTRARHEVLGVVEVDEEGELAPRAACWSATPPVHDLLIGFRALIDELLLNVDHLTEPGLVRQLRYEMAWS